MTTYLARDTACNWIEVRLYSLDEYEANGGIYSDVGNSGESVDEADYIGAATVHDQATGAALDQADAVRVLGVDGAWCDSVTRYILLPAWPAEPQIALVPTWDGGRIVTCGGAGLCRATVYDDAGDVAAHTVAYVHDDGTVMIPTDVESDPAYYVGWTDGDTADEATYWNDKIDHLEYCVPVGQWIDAASGRDCILLPDAAGVVAPRVLA